MLRAASTTVFAILALAGSAVRGVAAGNTQIMLFNQAPATSFSVRKNNVVVATPVASPSGALVYVTNAANGDRFEFLAGGIDTQGPVPPTNLKVTESSAGCASLTWTRSSDPLVTGYRVYFGTTSRSQGAYTDSLDAGNAAGAQRCGLAQGNHYFAVRSYTGAGAQSGFSKEVVLRDTDTVAPTITELGAIVPDGYWANDPARPLEVRDLPPHWGIHIFDTSGASVRHHVNQKEGATWTWDFRNEEGGRVAPALYLVRVTDGTGAVQRSGRFLVQSQR